MKQGRVLSMVGCIYTYMDFKVVNQERRLLGNELKYVTDAVQTGWISSAGKYVTEFEQKYFIAKLWLRT